MGLRLSLMNPPSDLKNSLLPLVVVDTAPVMMPETPPVPKFVTYKPMNVHLYISASLIVQQTLPKRIHPLVSVCLPHLGEILPTTLEYWLCGELINASWTDHLIWIQPGSTIARSVTNIERRQPQHGHY